MSLAPDQRFSVAGGPAIALALFFTALFFGGYIFNNFDALLLTTVKGTDYSLIALQAHRAKSFDVLVGPYSRFSFNHPGPIQFYLYALSEVLPISYSAAHAICQLAINTACFFGLIFVAARLWGAAVATAVGCSIGLAVYLNLGLLSDTWGPSVIFVPYLLFLVSGAGVGRLSGALLICVFTASWAVSNHLGLLVTVILVSSWVGWCVWKEGKISRWELAAALTTAAVIFALPIYELFLNYPLNNMQRFMRFLSRYDPTVSIADVWQALGQVFPNAYLFLVLGGISAAILFIRTSTRDFGGILALAALGHLFSVSQTVGRLHSYLFWPLLSVLCVATAVLGSAFASRFKFTRLLLVILGGALLLTLGQTFQHDSGKSPELYAKVMQDVERHPDAAFKLMTRRHQNWEVMTAAADTLARNGRVFCVQERLEFIFGRDLTCGSVPTADHVVLWFGESLK